MKLVQKAFVKYLSFEWCDWDYWGHFYILIIKSHKMTAQKTVDENKQNNLKVANNACGLHLWGMLLLLSSFFFLYFWVVQKYETHLSDIFSESV